MSFIKGERTLRIRLSLCITSNKEPRTRLKITLVAICKLRTKPNITSIVTVITDIISVAIAVIAVIVVVIVEITNIKANTIVLMVGKAINRVEAIS
jgi:hypothetical protein